MVIWETRIYQKLLQTVSTNSLMHLINSTGGSGLGILAIAYQKIRENIQ